MAADIDDHVVGSERFGQPILVIVNHVAVNAEIAGSFSERESVSADDFYSTVDPSVP